MWSLSAEGFNRPKREQDTKVSRAQWGWIKLEFKKGSKTTGKCILILKYYIVTNYLLTRELENTMLLPIIYEVKYFAKQLRKDG